MCPEGDVVGVADDESAEILCGGGLLEPHAAVMDGVAQGSDGGVGFALEGEQCAEVVGKLGAGGMHLHEALLRFLHLHDVAKDLIGLERSLEAVVVGQGVGEDLFAEWQQPGDGELCLRGLAELIVGVGDREQRLL